MLDAIFIMNLHPANSLKHPLNDSKDEYDVISSSTFTDLKTLTKSITSNNSTLSILSLNAQSINATFYELQIKLIS